jgi:hypothetical protein
LLAALTGLSLSATAGAFCRTTTCEASDNAAPNCTGEVDANGCFVNGKPLYWPERCLSFGVQENGSPKRNITWQEADRILSTAFAQWQYADCGGGTHPSFKMFDVDSGGPIVCDQAEFNQNGPNANILIFRDDEWPHMGAFATLALTTVTFETATGRILDADIEVNSFAQNLTISDTHVGSDLQSILTHETGHFLGMSHSRVPQATMSAQYSSGDLSFRTLDADDVQGICTVYPPARAVAQCNAPDGSNFSRLCGSDMPRSSSSSASSGCAVSPARTAGPFLPVVGALSALGIWIRRRRGRR